MNFLILIAIILLLFAIILPFKLQLKVIDSTCPQDIKAVRNNKISLIVCASLGIILLIIGLMI